MSRYRIAYCNDDILVPFVVYCFGDCLAHQIDDALRAAGWSVEITKEPENWTVVQDSPRLLKNW